MTVTWYFKSRLVKYQEFKLGPSCIEAQKILARRQSENRPWKKTYGRYPYTSSLTIDKTRQACTNPEEEAYSVIGTSSCKAGTSSATEKHHLD